MGFAATLGSPAASMLVASGDFAVLYLVVAAAAAVSMAALLR